MSKVIQIYTDGACSGNPGPGGTGYHILQSDKEGGYTSGTGYRKTTNNRMEILAVVEALQHLNKNIETYTKRDTDVKVTVFSDSQLVVNTMNKGWGRNSNNDLWTRLDKAIDLLGLDVTFVKVKGHADNKYNNEADAAAVSYSKNPTESDEFYENISRGTDEKAETGSLFSNEEPEIVNVSFRNHNNVSKREIVVELSNGSKVTISALYEGFEQHGCTTRESAITVDIANKYNGWLHGKNL